jgi:hypothetical protein
MTWILALPGKIKFYALAFAGVIAALVAGYWRARADGKAAAKADQAAAREKLQEKYDEIDRQAVDPAGSYECLRRLGMPDRK